jgi:hypothetical protein
MRKKVFFRLLPVLLLISLFFWSACQPKNTQPTMNKKKNLSVSFCIDILGENEPIFTKPLLNTLLSFEKRDDLQLQTVLCQNRSDYLEGLTICAKNSDFVIAGSLMAEEVREIATHYPDNYFILFDFSLPGKNIISVVFPEEGMAKIAWDSSIQQSKTKKIGAIFPGNPEHPLSVLLQDIWKLGSVDFVPFDASASSVIKTLQRFQQEKIDFVYLAKASYLEDAILTLSKEEGNNLHLVCPRVILNPEQSSVVTCQIEKNYDAILKNLFQDYRAGALKAKTYFVSDFTSVLTK